MMGRWFRGATWRASGIDQDCRTLVRNRSDTIDQSVDVARAKIPAQAMKESTRIAI
jgi:hypothetical protein